MEEVKIIKKYKNQKESGSDILNQIETGNNQSINQYDTNSKQGLQQLLDTYGSIRAVSRETGVPKSTLQDRINKFNLKSPYQLQVKGNVIFNDRNPVPENADIDDLIQTTIALQRSIENLSTKQTKLSLEIKDNKPIGILFWGDWHLGSKGTDHLQWKHDVETISNLDNVYYIGMGDYCNLSLNAHKGEDLMKF